MKTTIMATLTLALMVGSMLASGTTYNEYEGETKVVTVDSTNLRFSPDTITLKEGDTVRFFWSGELLPHNAVEDSGLFDTGEPSTEVDYTYTFSFGENGTYEYVCEPHEDLGMVGTIIVEPNPELLQNNSVEPDDDNDELQTQSDGFQVPHVELVVLIGVVLLIYQGIRVRSFGDIKLQKVHDEQQEMEAELLE
tara:strand:- start:73 stop:654 length:582 start_codon:yes stop_codon:yes gene_type:complete